MGRLGYYVSLYGSALVLFWIGLFKFTLREAEAIRPLVEHHPLSFWVYSVFSVRAVSNFVGIVEIAIAALLILSPWSARVRRMAGVGMLVTFVITLSYLFTTPGTWRMVEWMPVTDFFILKDVVMLGFGLMLLSGRGARR